MCIRVTDSIEVCTPLEGVDGDILSISDLTKSAVDSVTGVVFSTCSCLGIIPSDRLFCKDGNTA